MTIQRITEKNAKGFQLVLWMSRTVEDIRLCRRWEDLAVNGFFDLLIFTKSQTI